MLEVPPPIYVQFYTVAQFTLVMAADTYETRLLRSCVSFRLETMENLFVFRDTHIKLKFLCKRS